MSELAIYHSLRRNAGIIGGPGRFSGGLIYWNCPGCGYGAGARGILIGPEGSTDHIRLPDAHICIQDCRITLNCLPIARQLEDLSRVITSLTIGHALKVWRTPVALEGITSQDRYSLRPHLHMLGTGVRGDVRRMRTCPKFAPSGSPICLVSGSSSTARRLSGESRRKARASNTASISV
jgi:hypothetical protein